jgi:hypothetical protein
VIEGRGAKEIEVDPPEAAPQERVLLDETEDLFVHRRRRLRQVRRKPQNLRAAAQMPERQLARDERMAEDLRVLEQPL